MLSIEEFTTALIEAFFNVAPPTIIPTQPVSTVVGASQQQMQIAQNDAIVTQNQQIQQAYKRQLAQNLSQIINHQLESMINDKIRQLVDVNSTVGLSMPNFPDVTPLPDSE